MKRLNVKPYVGLLVLIALFSACSGPTENAGSSNTNTPQQANSNSSGQPDVAQSNAPSGAALTVQTIPQPPTAVGDTVKPAEKPGADLNANTANAASAGRVRLPKLVAPDKKVNFGEQPQNKTLIRAIAIRNGGRADLNIEAVVPS
ncbi:MAG: hypothetical protein AABN33_04465 [Acidobacteriota bacterium]